MIHGMLSPAFRMDFATQGYRDGFNVLDGSLQFCTICFGS